MRSGDRLGAAMARRSALWWPRMLVAQLGIVLSVLAVTARVALPPPSTSGSGGTAPGITTSLFPDAALHVKVVPREGFRLERARHLPSLASPGPAGALVQGRVPPLTLRPEMVHGSPRRSALHQNIALRAPPSADRLS
jgi:hypothetical protein